MKNKLFIIFSLLLVTCLIIGGTYVVNAVTSDELKMKWCSGNNTDSASANYGKFSMYYQLEDPWKDVTNNVNCSLSNGYVLCSYKAKTNGMYKMTIEYNDVIKYAYPDNNGYISFDVSAPAGTEVSLNSYPIKVASELNGVCKVNGIKNDIIVEENNDLDKGKREYSIYNFSFSIPYTKKNPYPNSSICSSIKKYATGSYSNYVKNAVPECFDTSEIDIYTSDADVSSKVDEVLDYVQNVANLKNDTKSSTTSSLYCQFDTEKNKANSSNSTNSSIKSYTYVENIKDNSDNVWYKVACTEDMNIQYDSPKASYSGGGFKYTIKLSSTKKCSVYSVRQPVKPTICRPSYYFSDHNSSLGGPNEDFIQCVSACDGGTYSKECSNKCYSEVYENKKTVKQTTFSSNSNLGGFNNIDKAIYIDESNGVDCYVGRNSLEDVPSQRSYSVYKEFGYYHWEICPSARTLADNKAASTRSMYPGSTNRKSISNGKDTDGKTIKVNTSGFPYGCVYGWQSETCTGKLVCNNQCSSSSVETVGQQNYLYQQELAKQQQAKNKIKEKYNCKENSNGTWSCDTLTTTETAIKDATITRSVNNKSNSLADNDGNVNFAGNISPDISYNANKTNYFINFPKAFIALNGGSIKYSNQNSIKMTNYMFGGYLFYTAPGTTAKESNDIRYYPYNASTFNINDGIMSNSGLGKNSKYANNIAINWNIITQIRNFGSYGQWDIDVNCFYGADVSKCGDDPEEECNCTDGDCDDSNGNIAGLPYMYRTVNLEDLFPNRNPGYNWTNNNANKLASTSTYTINPEELITSVQSQGSSIYSANPFTSFDSNSINRAKTSNDLYTNFNGSYTNKNGISFFNSSYASGVKNNSNRTTG